MPWKETTTMEQKIEFICEWNSQKYSISELCRVFEISRPTAYKLINKYEKFGLEGLLDDSKAPRHHPNQTDPKVVDKVLKLKERHKTWGAKKLRVLLFNDFTENQIPSVVTVHNILKKKRSGATSKKVKEDKAYLPYF